MLLSFGPLFDRKAQSFYKENMKRNLGICLLAIMAGGAVAVQADQTINTFDTAAETASWSWENWSATGVINFDPADDAAGDAASGSMQLLANFDAKADYQQSVFTAQVP